MLEIKKRIGLDKVFDINGRLIPNHFPKSYITKSQIYMEIINAEIQEFKENFFNGRLLNTNYHDIKESEYEKVDFLLQKNINLSRTDFSKYKQKLYQDIMHGNCRLPVMLKGTNNIFWLLSGDNEMVMFKVMGIRPTVKIINIQTEIV